MNDLFDENGHLTDYALKALSGEELTELERLEISEHLSFCDDCIIRYTAQLSDDILIVPPQTFKASVMQKIKNRARVIFINKYFSMAVAAGFAIVFWINGVFSPQTMSKPYIQAADTVAQSTSSFTQKAADISEGFSNGINSIMNDLFTKGDMTNAKK